MFGLIAHTVSSFLVKRKSHSKSKSKKKSKSKSKKSSDCSKRSCPMKLKPCPKDCPQSCGYLSKSTHGSLLNAFLLTCFFFFFLQQIPLIHAVHCWANQPAPTINLNVSYIYIYILQLFFV